MYGKSLKEGMWEYVREEFERGNVVYGRQCGLVLFWRTNGIISRSRGAAHKIRIFGFSHTHVKNFDTFLTVPSGSLLKFSFFTKNTKKQSGHLFSTLTSEFRGMRRSGSTNNRLSNLRTTFLHTEHLVVIDMVKSSCTTKILMARATMVKESPSSTKLVL